ncbi:hypothetical protein EDD15DRAFT_2518383 [Pisolithus albus]|nr:hypothetical protein EDD15DRAFT_2518383 [Pisolithus albus]
MFVFASFEGRFASEFGRGLDAFLEVESYTMLWEPTCMSMSSVISEGSVSIRSASQPLHYANLHVCDLLMLNVSVVRECEYSIESVCVFPAASTQTVDFVTTRMVLMYILAKSTVVWRRKKGAFALSWRDASPFYTASLLKKATFRTLSNLMPTVRTIPEQRLPRRTPKNQKKNMIGAVANLTMHNATWHPFGLMTHPNEGETAEYSFDYRICGSVRRVGVAAVLMTCATRIFLEWHVDIRGELIEESGPVPEAAASRKSVYNKTGVTRSTHHEKGNKNCDRRLPGDTT